MQMSQNRKEQIEWTVISEIIEVLFVSMLTTRWGLLFCSNRVIMEPGKLVLGLFCDLEKWLNFPPLLFIKNLEESVHWRNLFSNNLPVQYLIAI